jgi:acetyl-CoA carboxylase biotin carboxylase subunit
VEVQILADESVQLHLWERDCSIQRRHQKVIEESPAPGLRDDLRRDLAQRAVDLTRHLGYTNAGTVEFLVGTDGEFYFIELNSRLQVEHSVTEATTGIDIVKKQLEIAAGDGIEMTQDEIVSRGHAIECRVLAEDASRDWTPASGTITRFVIPGGPGIRVDTHVHSGYHVPSNYDSLLAKIVCWGRDRPEALARARRAVSECEIVGVTSNLLYLRDVLSDPAFVRGQYDLDQSLGASQPVGALAAV